MASDSSGTATAEQLKEVPVSARHTGAMRLANSHS